MRLEAGAAQDFGAGGAGLPCGAGDVPGVHPMFPDFTFRNTWMAVEPYAAQDSEASISLSSDTDESVDTQSDKEAIVLPEIE